MKKNISHALLCLLAVSCVSFLQLSCKKDHIEKTYTTTTYTISTPVYKEKSAFLSQINGIANEPVKNAGKIYIKDNFIFLSEVDKGIHVINNSNPSRPVQTAFFNVPGNQDIAVKGNTLYADMYNDLLAIDITDISHARVTKTLHNLFSDRYWPNGNAPDTNLVIVGWTQKDTTVTFENNSNGFNVGVYDVRASSLQNYSNTKSSQTGVAGSMSRMVLMNNYLYAITAWNTLGIVNISNVSVPYVASTITAGLSLETIYPFEGKLFMGSTVGLFMYDVSDPEHPAKLGELSHVRSCDPVVTDGKFAYVTLRAGSTCGGAANQLDVIDIYDLLHPSLVKTYPMTSPTGLSKDGNLLFICDGKSGIRLYNAADPVNLRLLNRIDSKEPYDIIAGNNKALVVAKDGIYQYDYSNIYNIRQLSVISVQQ